MEPQSNGFRSRNRSWSSLLLFFLLAAPAQAAPLNLTWEQTPKALRLTLPVAATQDFLEERRDDHYVLRLPGVSGPVTLPDFPPKTGVLGPLKTSQEGQALKLSFGWSYPIPTSVKREKTGLVIEWSRDYSLINRIPLAQGVMMEQLWWGTEHGPVCANVIRADLNTPGVRLRPVLPGERFGLATVSSMAKQNGALAAINGTYFFKNGQPAGLLVLDGKVVSGPLYNRSVLGLRAMDAFIDNTQLNASLTLPDGQSTEIDGINQSRQRDSLILYDHAFGSSTNTTPEDSIEYLLTPGGTVWAIRGSNSPIPKEGWVLSASGANRNWLADKLKVGDTLQLKSLLGEYWEDVPFALGGGPTLLKEGRIAITAQEERFRPDIAEGRAPRTAVGITPYGEVILVVVDGRQPRYSVGMTLTELAKFLLDLGAKDAINLDGGGSSTVYASGMVVNRVSDGHERKVGNALLLFGLP